ncbi:NtaA/DmoA family FMN-dependent monooxygenase [Rathayibacter caricis]|uniref:NtaA/DmoA family FMN-dependent monooxygenase n=1 Tax=Rathayibacter caricis TaxID=110936 RepID=UPI001FB1D905|nr:NtaA/DmoA family FMN-dependent monooxygenase [Rathayibacter caricis]MCJ1697805.1 NtaA/DmoA family FMN-dependent monooxygenase [Rathayibacter caricis]
MTIILGAFQTMNPNGTVGASWRHPENTSSGYLSIAYWTDLARTLEDGGFDFLFFADSYGYPTVDGELLPGAVANGMYVPMADPITIVSAAAAVTSRLGFVVTSSTTVERPAAIARRYGTLDHLTEGRIGWNVVTGAAQGSSAALFGEEMMKHDDRYAQAADHLTICLKLWEGSWEDDALELDTASGIFAEPGKVHQIEHDGAFLRARGMFAVPPSPQRSPLILQAGTSKAGRDFAARYAEVVFIGGGDTEQIREQIADIRERVARAGREPSNVKFLVGAHFVVGTDGDQASRKRADMLAYATLEQAAITYAWITGIDLSRLPLDEPMPTLTSEMGQTSIDRFMDPVEGRRKTVREVLTEFRDNGINGTVFVGAAEAVADQVEAFLARTDADGFLVQPHLTPGTYTDFIELLMPELRARGLLDAHEGSTLRARLVPEGGDRLPDTHTGASFRRSAVAVGE